MISALEKKIAKRPLALASLFFLSIVIFSFTFFTVKEEKVATKPEVQAITSNFVTSNGKQLILNGNTIKFIGVNRYNLATIAGNPAACGGPYTDQDLVNWFSELKQMKVNSIRIPIFQSYTKSGSDMTKVDRILSLSAQNGIKVIPVLESQWETCTQGGYKYNTWYQTGYLSPYGNYPLSYKDYVTFIVNRYKDNPTISMWQMMGEAESKDTAGNADSVSLYNFTRDMSNYIRSLDSNHLISLGTIGFGQPGTGGEAYRQLHSLPNINVLEFHDYGFETQAIPPGLQERINDSIALNKPLIVGEAGIVDHCTGTAEGLTCYTKEQRAAYFNSKMTTFFNNGGAAYLIWEYRDWAGANLLTFDFDQSDPLVQTITYIASTLNSSIPTSNPTIIPTPTNIPTPTGIPTSQPTIIPTPTNSPNDTVPPTISITSPANNSTYIKNTSIKITANATDNVKVTKVEFFANNSKICSDSSAPFECSWRPSKANNYTIKATAFDAANNQQSSSVQIKIINK